MSGLGFEDHLTDSVSREHLARQWEVAAQLILQAQWVQFRVLGFLCRGFGV